MKRKHLFAIAVGMLSALFSKYVLGFEITDIEYWVTSLAIITSFVSIYYSLKS